MLVETELSVKVESKIPPVGLGCEWGVPSVRGISEVYARKLLAGACEMKEICFIMFQSEACPREEVK